MEPIVQISLDFETLKEALEVAEVAVAAGVDYLEVGTPLILGEGIHAVTALSKRYPGKGIVADIKGAALQRGGGDNGRGFGDNIKALLQRQGVEDFIRNLFFPRCGKNGDAGARQERTFSCQLVNELCQA